MWDSPIAYRTSCRAIIMITVALLLVGISTAIAQTTSANTPALSLQRLENVNQPLLDDSPRQVFELTLEDCIHRALLHNLDIRVGSYGPAIQMTDVVRAEAVFDAVLFGSAQFQNIDRATIDSGFIEQTEITPAGTVVTRVPTNPFDRVHDYNYSVGLRKRLSTGAVLELAQNLRRYRDLTTTGDSYYRNPFHEFALQFQISQPLLRDFGVDINRASINASRNNYRIGQQQFRLLVIDTLKEVETNYWSLVFARQQLNVFQGLLAEAENTLARIESRATQDTNTELLSQTNSLMQRARANILTSLNNVLSQQDRLLESLNDPELPVGSTYEIVPTDRPVQIECEIDEVAALQTALQLRPEIIAQRIRLETAGIALDVAQNQTLPRLDLFASQEISGAGHAEHSAWDQQMTNETIDYTVGVSFEVPIGNRAALAGLQRSQSEQQQEVARLESIRQQVLTEVQIAVSSMRYAQQEIAARTTAALAEFHTLEAYRTQIEAEVGANPGFLDRNLRAQERLANALLTLSQVVSRYNLSIMETQRAQGTLLQYNNVQIAELSQQ
ncbi:MAG: TolC family protein [Sedimentisphaerales bacterium]|nr:TolC family protein [Sedimentisphaerales bacterium]